MFLEALVISICVQGQDGCSQVTSAYYQQSRELQAISDRVERIGKNITNEREWLVYVGTPAYAIISRKPAKILVYKGTTFNIDPWNNAVGLQWSY